MKALPRRHTLRATSENLHGQFSPELPPALEVDDGDRVVIETPDVMWGVEQHGRNGEPRRRAESRGGILCDGPALIGPIALRGVTAGATVEVHLDRIVTAPWGWTYAGPTGINAAYLERLGLSGAQPALLRWTIKRDEKVATSDGGTSAAVRPFLGNIGTCPSGGGWHSGWTPRLTGGNVDCRELVEGSVIFLPAEVDGANLSLGDGHAAQGDGEVAGSAIECPMEAVELRLYARSNLPGARQMAASTPAGWIEFGIGKSLDDAAAQCLHALTSRIVSFRGSVGDQITVMDALAMSSPVASLRVTQMVNGVVGVHVVVPNASIGWFIGAHFTNTALRTARGSDQGI